MFCPPPCPTGLQREGMAGWVRGGLVPLKILINYSGCGRGFQAGTAPTISGLRVEIFFCAEDKLD